MEPIQDDSRCPTCQRPQFGPSLSCPDPFHVEPIQDDRPTCPTCGNDIYQQGPAMSCPDPFHREPIQDDPYVVLLRALQEPYSIRGDGKIDRNTVTNARVALDRSVAERDAWRIEALHHNEREQELVAERDHWMKALVDCEKNEQVLFAERDRLIQANARLKRIEELFDALSQRSAERHSDHRGAGGLNVSTGKARIRGVEVDVEVQTMTVAEAVERGLVVMTTEEQG